MHSALDRRQLMRCALLGTLTATQWSSAQEAYPSKPIRIIVPLPAGGVVDVGVRILAQPLQRRHPRTWHQQAREKRLSCFINFIRHAARMENMFRDAITRIASSGIPHESGIHCELLEGNIQNANHEVLNVRNQRNPGSYTGKDSYPLR